jgi:hypothetical protein
MWQNAHTKTKEKEKVKDPFGKKSSERPVPGQTKIIFRPAQLLRLELILENPWRSPVIQFVHFFFYFASGFGSTCSPCMVSFPVAVLSTAGEVVAQIHRPRKL